MYVCGICPTIFGFGFLLYSILQILAIPTSIVFFKFQITKLKIDSNPFAKGFRDSSRLSDFERYVILFTFALKSNSRILPFLKHSFKFLFISSESRITSIIYSYLLKTIFINNIYIIHTCNFARINKYIVFI